MIVILMGMSAVGKDSVRRVLEREYGYSNIVSYTSRGMRVGERTKISIKNNIKWGKVVL